MKTQPENPQFNEADFQNWYAGYAGQFGGYPDPDQDPNYDYRKAYLAGAIPNYEDGDILWPAEHASDKWKKYQSEKDSWRILTNARTAITKSLNRSRDPLLAQRTMQRLYGTEAAQSPPVQDNQANYYNQDDPGAALWKTPSKLEPERFYETEQYKTESKK